LIGVVRLVLEFDTETSDSTFTETPTAAGDAGTDGGTGQYVYTYEFPGVNGPASLEVTGEDAGAIVRVRGRSAGLAILAGRIVDVAVFMAPPSTFVYGPPGVRLATARAHHGAAVVGGAGFLVAGGAAASGAVDSIELFDLRAWDAVADTPRLPSLRSRFALVALDPNTLLFVGGVPGDAAINVFDGPSGEWSSYPLPEELPAAWIEPRAAVLPDLSAVLLGGTDADDRPVAAVARAGPTGINLLSTTTARRNPTATTIDTPDGIRVLVYGGNAEGEVRAALFDPDTDELTEIVEESMTDARERHTVVRVGPRRAVVAGGVDPTGDLATHAWVADMDCLGADSGCAVFSDTGPTLSALPFADAVGIGIDESGDDPRALFVCGVDETDDPVRDAVIIDGEAGGLIRLPLKTPRSACAAVRLPTGQIAVIGGIDADGNPLDTIELLQPAVR
jgi:hypothetical protein